MLVPACCICAEDPFSDSPPVYGEQSEKEIAPVRLNCCQRALCPACVQNYPRFRTYCPYCQKSLSGVEQESNGKGQDQPAWHSSSMVRKDTGPPSELTEEKDTTDAPDVLHFVDPSIDTLGILSIRYGVPAGALRRTNAIFSDHLLAARRTILIPGEFYKGGVSLSPQPKGGEEEEIRKGKIRRFQVASKCSE
jgi:hypothetical protein